MSLPSTPYHLAVIGGGAAGIFAAINLARLQPGCKIVVLEKSSRLLSKVKVSGGGRCNVTHACFDKRELPKFYPRGGALVKQYVHHFFTTDTIQWFRERGVMLKEEADGRMFPVTDNSQTIIDVLLKEASQFGVEFRLNAAVESVTNENGFFSINFTGGRTLLAKNCCIATGGFPKDEQYQWIKNLGHNIHSPVPSLFTFNCPQHRITKLMGISVPQVKVKIAGTKLIQTGPVLITHWGLSGPAVLRLSAWAARELHDKNYRFDIQINWLEGESWNASNLADYFEQQRQQHASQLLRNSKIFQLPMRLWEFMLQEAGIGDTIRFAELTRKDENKLIRLLTDMVVSVNGKTTFKEEFVTAGGIKLEEIDSRTLQSKLVNGLYFAGEIMDVDGITGGFNFQHAWSSGFLVASSIASRFANQH
jgi:predicted Rossmann fold flavoprotein